MLLKIQRNELLECLQRHGIPIINLIEKREFKSYNIKFIDEHYHFTVSLSNSVLGGEFSIESDPFTPVSPWDAGYQWAGLVSAFNQWADKIQLELETPDLWAEATKTAQLFAPTAPASDDKFTRTELAEVQGQLRLLQQSFAAAALPEAARQKLIALTQTAAVKAEGFTKKDWQSWFIGALIGHITEAVLNSDQIHDVYKLVKAAFGGLFLY